MKIPIKFRGRDLNIDKRHYGSFVHTAPMSSFPAIVDDNGMIHEVDPDSVVQLVGYDVEGNEVYVGDTLEDILGNEYTSKIRIELSCDDPQSYNGKGYYAGTVDNLKLKE